jgi:hypothetical protein
MTYTRAFKKRQGITYEDRGRAGRQTKITWALIIMRAHQQLRHQAKQYKKRVTHDTYESV